MYDKWDNSKLVDAIFWWGINELAEKPIEEVIRLEERKHGE